MHQKRGTRAVECGGIHRAAGRHDNRPPRSPCAAANRLPLGDLGARMSALREGHYEAGARLDHGRGLPNETVVLLLGRIHDAINRVDIYTD